MAIIDSNSSAILGTTCLLLVAYVFIQAIYRITFHPLARFPGPKLAAVSKWYEFYYEVITPGQFMFNIQELHKRYGPIIRITPEELHVADPDFFTEYLTQQGPQHKYDWNANRFVNATSSFSTVSHDLHKLRRGALENMFSRTQVRQLLPILQEKTANLMSKFVAYQESGKPINLTNAFMALSEDMIFEYGFGSCPNRLDSPEFSGLLYPVFVAAGAASGFILHFPWIGTLLNSLPDNLVMKLDPGMGPLVKLKRDFRTDIDRLSDPSYQQSSSSKAHRTVMASVLNDPRLPLSEKTPQRLLDESQVIIGAGLITTGWAAAVAIYYILADLSILNRVREELFTIIPRGEKKRDCSDLDWTKLESLPYFQACLREALRLSYGMTARTSRRTPKPVIFTEKTYTSIPNSPTSVSSSPTQNGRTWTIPANTPVSMSTYIAAHNEDIFPDSHSFKPERWLPTSPKIPERYFVAFGKGSRMCLGMQLAWAELSLMISATVRWWDVELWETRVRDVKPDRDFALPVAWEGSLGVRGLVRGEVE